MIMNTFKQAFESNESLCHIFVRKTPAVARRYFYFFFVTYSVFFSSAMKLCLARLKTDLDGHWGV